MNIAAERDRDTLDIAHLLRKLNITNATDAVDRAFDAATTLAPENSA